MSQSTGDKTVLCIVCPTIHPTLPPASTRIIGTETVTGYHASDYTYYKDFYKGVCGVICKEHSRDEISKRKDSEIDGEYTYNGS